MSFAKAIKITGHGEIHPDPLHVDHGQNVTFENFTDCEIVIDLPNQLFGDHEHLKVAAGSISEFVPVSPDAKIHETYHFEVSGPCIGNQQNNDDGGGYGGGRTGKIIVDN